MSLESSSELSVRHSPALEGVTAAELGDFIGVSARAVANLGKRGVAVKAGPGRWRLRESLAPYAGRVDRRLRFWLSQHP
jgi:hypothetical protein